MCVPQANSVADLHLGYVYLKPQYNKVLTQRLGRTDGIVRQQKGC
jgi:hypothetical protein